MRVELVVIVLADLGAASFGVSSREVGVLATFGLSVAPHNSSLLSTIAADCSLRPAAECSFRLEIELFLRLDPRYFVFKDGVGLVLPVCRLRLPVVADCGSRGGGISVYFVSCFGGWGGYPWSLSTAAWDGCGCGRLMLLLEVFRFQLKLIFRLNDVADDASSLTGDCASDFGDFVSLFVCARGPLTFVGLWSFVWSP